MNPYDRIEVLVLGKELLSARPIDFVFEKGEPKKAIKYETTCPGCGCMIQFDISNAKKNNAGVFYIGCGNCPSKVPKDFNAIKEEKRQSSSEISVKESGQVVKKLKFIPSLKDKCPFVDPVELGIFDITKV